MKVRGRERGEEASTVMPVVSPGLMEALWIWGSETSGSSMAAETEVRVKRKADVRRIFKNFIWCE